MVIAGHVENGQIVLDENVQLEEGVKVSIRITPTLEEDSFHPVIKRLSGILPPGLDIDEVRYDIERFRSK